MTRIDRVAAASLALLLCAGAGATLAQQQSLAEVARQTAESRNAKGKATKTYTNDDLKGGRPITVARGSSEKPAEGQATADDTAKAADPTSKRLQELKTYVAERRDEAERLQRRLSELNDAVLNSFDEAQRQALVRDRDATLNDLRKAQLDVEAQSKAASDLEAEAARRPAPAPQKPQ